MRPSRFVLASSIALLAPTLVFAQAPAERLNRPASEELGVTTMPEVVVTGNAPTSYSATEAVSATRLQAPILDTPRNVQVVTRQVIEDRAVVNIQDAVQTISGVQRGSARSGVGESYNVRGFAQESLFKDGFRSGEAQGSSLFTFEGPNDIANIERVEVLKGPSAILYGRGEPGGTVNYITRTPAFENRFSLQQSVGSNEFYRTDLSANWNAVPDRLAIRLDGAYQNTESFIDFVEGERWFLAPSFKWQVGPDTTVTFRGEYNNDKSSSVLAVPYAFGQVVPGPYNRYYGEPGFTEMESENLRGLLQVDHRWNESHRTVVSGHAARNESSGGNFILYNFSGDFIDPITGDVNRAAEDVDFRGEYYTARVDHTWDWTIYESPGSAAPVPSGKDDGKATKDGKDVKEVVAPVTGGWAIKNQLLVSGEFERQTTEGERYLSMHTPLNPQNPNYTGYTPLPLLNFIPGYPNRFLDDRSTDGDATSVLLMDRLSFGETVYLSFGGRYEWFDGKSRYDYAPESGFGSGYNELDEETFNPFVGLVVKPARNWSIYGSFAESQNTFKNIGSVTVSGSPLDPEKSRQWEVGTKAEFFGGKVFTTLSLFQINKKDVAATDMANPLFSINAGEERSRGVEFDISGEPLPGWRITANYAYIDAEVHDDPSGVNTGNRKPGVPEHSGAIFTTYEIQDGFLKGFGFGGGVVLSDRVEVDYNNTGNLSGWAETEAILYYRRDRFRAQLNVKNLFDNEYYFTANTGNEAIRGSARTVIGSVRYEF